MSFGFKCTVNILCSYSCHIFCILNILRAPRMGECSLGLPSSNKDIIIIIIIIIIFIII